MESKPRKVRLDNDGTHSAMTYFAMRCYEMSGAAWLRHWWLSANQVDGVFIWIPKNAGTSFFEILARHGAPKCKSVRRTRSRFPQRGLVTFGHMDYDQLVKENYVTKEFDESAVKFCFSRNPFPRAVSLYNYLDKPNPEYSFLDFCRDLAERGCHPIGLYNRYHDSQCNPQVRWVENVNLDFVGSIEQLDLELPKLLEMLSLPLEACPRRNQRRNGDKSWTSFYCDESQEIIREFYREDFNFFNYSLEFPDAVAETCG